MGNKKILGTNPKEYNNISFKSTLETSCYKLLELSKLNFSYESEKIVLWEGIKPVNILIYCPKKDSVRAGRYSKDIYHIDKKLINITYTPDFVIYKDGYKIYVDVKGKENDVYPIKKKLFLKILEERKDYKYIFFEPHTVYQMKEMINIIHKL